MNTIAPPGKLVASAGGLSLTGALAWVIYMLIELQSGQVRLDERLKAIEARLPPPPAFVQTH